MTKKTNQLIRTIKPIKPIKQIEPIESDRLVVNPSKYVSNYNKSITDKYSNNKSINRNSKNNRKTDVNILLIIVIVLAIIGVILVILHFEKDIFNTNPDPPTQNAMSTENVPEKFEQTKEVFFVENDEDGKKFKKNEAINVCEALDSKLATYTQLLEYTNNKGDKGAKWCKYGWLIDNREDKTGNEILGFYPNKGNVCNTTTAEPITGPQIEEKEANIKLNLGVNCYGMKPVMDQELKDKIRKKKKTEAIEIEKREQKEKEFSKRVKKSNIAPFNEDLNMWSENVPNEEYLKDPICDDLNKPC